MENHFGEIIYFLMIVAFAIIGMLGKKGKNKKQPNQPSTSTPSIPGSWEELEKQLRDKAETAKREKTLTQRPTERPIIKPKGPKEAPEPVFAHEYEKPVYEPMSYETVDDVNKLRVKKQMKGSVSSSLSGNKKLQVIQLSEVNEPHIEIELEEVEDARRAFIYSEIFNRKYI